MSVVFLPFVLLPVGALLGVVFLLITHARADG